MNFVIILATSLIVFILFRLIMSRVYCLIKKLLKSHEDSIGFSLSLSVVFFILYLQGYLGAIQGVMRNTELTNLEWYLVYTSIGMIAMLWCYFSWSFERGTKPQFSKKWLSNKCKENTRISCINVVCFLSDIHTIEYEFWWNIGRRKRVASESVKYNDCSRDYSDG